MEHNSTYFKIGIFVIIAVILGTTGIVIFGAGTLLRKEILVETYFDRSVQGLAVGSAVKYRGILIGNVKDISSVSSKYDENSIYVMTLVSLYNETLFKNGDSFGEKIALAVKKGLRFQLAPLGITGTMFLEADFLEAEKIKDLEVLWKPENPYVPSAPNTFSMFTESLDKILKNLEQINIAGITNKAETLLTTLNNKFDEMDVKEINIQVRGLLTELRESNAALKRTVASENVKKIIDDSHEIVRDSKPAIKKAVADIGAAAAISRKTAESAEKAFERLPEILDRTESLARRMDSISSEKGVAMSELIENIRKISENLEDLSQSAKKYPSHLIFGNPPEKEK